MDTITINLIQKALRQTEHELRCNATHDNEILADFCNRFSENIEHLLETKKMKGEKI